MHLNTPSAITWSPWMVWVFSHQTPSSRGPPPNLLIRPWRVFRWHSPDSWSFFPDPDPPRTWPSSPALDSRWPWCPLMAPLAPWCWYSSSWPQRPEVYPASEWCWQCVGGTWADFLLLLPLCGMTYLSTLDKPPHCGYCQSKQPLLFFWPLTQHLFYWFYCFFMLLLFVLLLFYVFYINMCSTVRQLWLYLKCFIKKLSWVELSWVKPSFSHLDQASRWLWWIFSRPLQPSLCPESGYGFRSWSNWCKVKSAQVRFTFHLLIVPV